MDVSSGSLLANLFVSAIGTGVLIYGKKQHRPPAYVVGLLLMGVPWVITGAVGMLLACGGLLGLLWMSARAGF